MADINDAGKVVSEFLKKTLRANDIKLIKTSKVGDCWEAEAEVYEESSLIKSLGLPTRVRDRNVYLVRLNNGLDVESYERKGQLS
jgi:hypothetical protein